MPIYRPIVPNGHTDSPQMISGSGLELSGGKFSLKDLAKGVGKAANVAIPLAQAFGVEGADQAAAINDAIQGKVSVKAPSAKCLRRRKRGARVSLRQAPIDEFGRGRRQTARTRAGVTVASIFGRADGGSGKMATPAGGGARKMVNRGVARRRLVKITRKSKSMDITQLAEISLEGSARSCSSSLPSKSYARKLDIKSSCLGNALQLECTTPATARSHPLRYLPPRTRSIPYSAIISSVRAFSAAIASPSINCTPMISINLCSRVNRAPTPLMCCARRWFRL